MGRKEVRRPHSLSYIRQLQSWGFTNEFIARDCGISIDSLERRLERARIREQNGKDGDSRSSLPR